MSDEKWKNLMSSTAHPDIVVKIDDWLADRKASGSSGLVYPSSQPNLDADLDAESIQEKLRQKELARHRASLLESAKECGECGTRREFYKNDYICFLCRDHLNE